MKANFIVKTGFQADVPTKTEGSLNKKMLMKFFEYFIHDRENCSMTSSMHFVLKAVSMRQIQMPAWMIEIMKFTFYYFSHPFTCKLNKFLGRWSLLSKLSSKTKKFYQNSLFF